MNCAHVLSPGFYRRETHQHDVEREEVKRWRYARMRRLKGILVVCPNAVLFVPEDASLMIAERREEISLCLWTSGPLVDALSWFMAVLRRSGKVFYARLEIGSA